MKVVHVTPYYVPEVEFGGPPATVHELCRALRGSGVAVDVVTTGAASREEVIDGVAVTRVERRTRLGFLAAIDRVLGERLGEADVCHVHALFNWPAWRAAALARRLERPVVVSPRGMLEAAALGHHSLRKRVAWQLFDRGVVRQAAAVVASTRDEADSLRARGVASVIVPNGVDIPALLPERGRFRASRGIAPEAPVIVFLGRLHPIKRLDLLAAAFVQIAERHPSAQVVLAGPDETGLWPELRETLARVVNRVHWIGPVGAADKWTLLADSDVLVLCSDSESYGRVVAEGLAAGVPAVVTHTCPWQIVEQEGMGCWVPQTAAALAGAIDRLLSDAASRGVMGARGRAYALAHLGWDRIVARYVALYESVVAASRAAAPAPQASS